MEVIDSVLCILIVAVYDERGPVKTINVMVKRDRSRQGAFPG